MIGAILGPKSGYEYGLGRASNGIEQERTVVVPLESVSVFKRICMGIGGRFGVTEGWRGEVGPSGSIRWNPTNI